VESLEFKPQPQKKKDRDKEEGWQEEETEGRREVLKEGAGRVAQVIRAPV
jgi:hypothetical protein